MTQGEALVALMRCSQDSQDDFDFCDCEIVHRLDCHLYKNPG